MSSEIKILKVAESLSNKRLDIGLTIAGVCLSRSQAQKLIQNSKVTVNRKPEKASYKLQNGDLIEVEIEAPKSIELTPYDFPLDVVFEDNSVIVVNKPAGLVVHPAYGHENDTLINALLHRNTLLAPTDEVFRPGLVHRIDKGTSGLLVLAKTEKAHSSLAKQFLKKTIHRRYWALCFSHQNMESGTIESFLTRDPNNRQRFMVSKTEGIGKNAITHYESLHYNSPFRLLQLQLETGRTHQIRVHLSSNSNPIVGDEVYNGKNLAKNLKNQKLKKAIIDMPRFALHAKELGFSHPETGEFIKFDSSIPEDLHFLFKEGGFFEFL